METRKSTYLKPVGTLQLIAIIAVVIGHFAVKEPAFMHLQRLETGRWTPAWSTVLYAHGPFL